MVQAMCDPQPLQALVTRSIQEKRLASFELTVLFTECVQVRRSPDASPVAAQQKHHRSFEYEEHACFCSTAASMLHKKRQRSSKHQSPVACTFKAGSISCSSRRFFLKGSNQQNYAPHCISRGSVHSKNRQELHTLDTAPAVPEFEHNHHRECRGTA